AFYAMQLLEGLSLRKVLNLRRDKGHPFSLVEAEPVIAQIGAALEQVHRVAADGNLRPENILVLPDLLKVTDFHLSSALPRAAFLAGQPEASPYLAPEVRSGGPISHASDVYGFAVIAHELVTGKTPEPGPLRLKELNPDLPPGLDALLAPCLDPDPTRRIADPRELARGVR